MKAHAPERCHEGAEATPGAADARQGHGRQHAGYKEWRALPPSSDYKAPRVAL